MRCASTISLCRSPVRSLHLHSPRHGCLGVLLCLLVCVGCRTSTPVAQPSLIPSPPIVQNDPSTRDRDRDGIVDERDACPNDPEDFDGLMDEDGCPEEDADLDGLLDRDDACPSAGETLNGFEDRDGCPDEARALCNDCQAIKRLVLVVYFDEGDEEIKPEELPMVSNLARELIDSEPALEIFIVGHTSDWGEGVDQKSLARQRALEIKDELVGLGVDEAAISVSGRGARSPRVPHGQKVRVISTIVSRFTCAEHPSAQGAVGSPRVTSNVSASPSLETVTWMTSPGECVINTSANCCRLSTGFPSQCVSRSPAFTPAF